MRRDAASFGLSFQEDLVPISRHAPPGPALRLVEAPSAPEPPVVHDLGELLRLARLRDPAAVGALFRRYAPRVHGILRRTLGPAWETEDAVQEVFLRLFSKLDKVYDAGSLDAFVVGITIRVARKELTARAARRWLLLSPSGSLDDEIAIPGLDIAAHQAVKRFFALLDRLSADSRTLFVLRHVEGMELVSIAAALEISLATVKRRLERVEARMAGWIDKEPALRDYTGSASAWLSKGAKS
jgi:RNA polymerase sigma-70 factor (ECF subfamily)